MAEKLEDLNLPNAVVTRIIKDALPEGINMAKEARTAISKSASVYILYLTAAANLEATGNNRKTISGQDVLNAVSNVEFGNFSPALVESLEYFKKMQKGKKDASAKRKMQKEGRRSDEHPGNDQGDNDSGMEGDFENGTKTGPDLYECDQ